MLTLHGHTARVHSVAFSPDGTPLASGSEDGSARIWDLPAGTLRSTLQLDDRATPGGPRMAVAPDGALGAIGSGAVQLWCLRDARLLRVFNETSAWISSAAARRTEGNEGGFFKL